MSLKALFTPRSIAVIGASTVKNSVGNDIAKNLVEQGYKGSLFLVNPKGGKLYGQPLIKDISFVEAEIDLAIVVVPASLVLEVIRKAIPKKLKAVVVISAGFKEVGNHQAELALAELCEAHQVTLIGPNCLGVINPEIKMNTSFAPLMPSMGKVAFISQSGAICASVLDYARERGLGFSKFISVGNKALVGEVELLQYLYQDDQTKVIALYAEQLKDIEALRALTSKVTRGAPHKPILILKSGRTEAGQKAASSHTGSMSGADVGYDALFSQTGMIRANSISELFDFAECFADNALVSANQVAVITNAGGPGVLTADELAKANLQLAKLQPRTQEKLRSFLPDAASVQNPIDILGDADATRYAKTLAAVAADQNVGAIQIILTPQSMTPVEATAREIVKARRHSQKPLVVTFMGQGLVEEGVEILQNHHIATTAFPEPGAKSLGALNSFVKWLKPARSAQFSFKDVKPEQVEKVLAQYRHKASKMLPPEAAFKILEAYHFPLVKRVVVTSQAEAEEKTTDFKQPLVMKIVSPDISHKSDVQGVTLEVNKKQLAAEFYELYMRVKKNAPRALLTGIEIMEMVTEDGLEIILGATNDSHLGTQLLVGLGGIYTEALQDVAWGLAPLTRADAERMIGSLKTAKILAGVRGQGPLAADVVAECLGRLSMLVSDFPELKEVDINPLKVLSHEKGAKVLDVRMILK